MNRTSLVFATSLSAICLSTEAWATSGATFGGPIGATDINNAYLPPEAGIFGGLANVYAGADRLFDNTGKDTRTTFDAGVAALYLGYEYPFKLFGGQVASGIQMAYASPSRFQISDQGQVYHTEGWEDIYVDFFNWSRYIGPLFGEHVDTKPGEHAEPVGLTLKAEYSMIFPIGINEPGRPINNSSDTYFFIPNLALTYLTKHDALGGGVEFNAHIFYDHQSIEPVTRYVNGDVFDIDYAIDQQIGKWSFGVVGAYAFQSDDDHIGSTLVYGTGNRIESLTAGPIIQRFFPKYGMFIKVKATFPIIARNTLGITNAISVIGFMF